MIHTKDIFDSLILVVNILFGSEKTVALPEILPKQTPCIYFYVFELGKVFIIKPERRLLFN